jgi:peroxiredoxin Q/BCP
MREHPVKIKAGQKAPDFSGTDTHGNLVNLDMYQGKLLLLAFHRLAACPFCGFRIYSLSLHYPLLHERGLEIVAVVESSEANIQRQPYAATVPFPIIADPQQQLYHRYGVGTSRFGQWWADTMRKGVIAQSERLGFGSGKVDGDPQRMPADFLIGPDQVVRYAHYGRDSGDSLQLQHIEMLIERFGVPQQASGGSSV